MTLLLGILIFSFMLNSILIIPYIDLLYKAHFLRHRSGTKDAFGFMTPIFDKLHHQKVGTPIGGGLLIITTVTALFLLFLPLIQAAGVQITHIYPIHKEIAIVLFTFISFGLLGLYDDIMKFFKVKQTGFFGLRLRHKFAIQWLLAFILAYLLYFWLEIDIVNLPFVGVLKFGWLFIPLAAFVIVSFTNAVNIADGLDGLASGVLLITLFALWILSSSILDIPLSVFLSLWIGALIAFLYFNVYPARIFLGDVGALSFGATIAVIGILIGKIMAVAIIGGIFVVELVSSAVQLLSKKILKKKAFPVAPFHIWLQMIGWEEPKIVMRVWLASIMLAVFGLWLAVI
jgi:phospho-N-acetylmuramoyl-pentapeptide-transferase